MERENSSFLTRDQEDKKGLGPASNTEQAGSRITIENEVTSTIDTLSFRSGPSAASSHSHIITAQHKPTANSSDDSDSVVATSERRKQELSFKVTDSGAHSPFILPERALTVPGHISDQLVKLGQDSFHAKQTSPQEEFTPSTIRRFSLNKAAAFFAISVIISSGLFVAYFEFSGPSGQVVTASESSLAGENKNAIDTQVAALLNQGSGQESQQDLNAEQNQMPGTTEVLLPKDSYSFDPHAQALETKVATGPRLYTFASEPRLSSQTSANDLSQLSNNLKNKTSQLSQSEIRLTPSLDGRYRADSGLDWQANWKLSSPEHNTKQAKEYLRYLDRQFSANAPLATKSLGKSPSALGNSLSKPSSLR